MAYVRVNIITPDEREYEAEVDENASARELLDGLTGHLDLKRTMDGRPVRYRLSLLDDLRIREGVTIKIDRDISRATSLVSAEAPSRDTPVLRTPTVLDKNLQAFKRDHDPSKTVFVMMKFSGGDSEKDRKLANLFTTIKLELDKYGLDAVRADEKTYCATQYMWDNAQVYMTACDYGIAVLEDIYLDEMNPNVALEYGYMLAKEKKVHLLKEKSFKNIRADILGKIWTEFDIDREKSVREAIQRWMVDLRKPRIKS